MPEDISIMHFTGIKESEKIPIFVFRMLKEWNLLLLLYVHRGYTLQ